MSEVKWGPLGYPVFKRTYARRIKESDPSSRTEEYHESVERWIKAFDKQLKCGFDSKEEDRLREIFMGMKGTIAGRFMWQLGTKTVDKYGLFSLQNCAFVPMNDPMTPFLWTFDALMLGVGVGFNIQREYVYELPKVVRRKVKITRLDTADADFIVPDSREGWIKLLRYVLRAHFIDGVGFTYSTMCVRPKGTLIKGFGGLASGPDPLATGIEQISNIFNSRSGKKLRTVDVLDIQNIIGSIVVAGNVRRSAQIALGDYDDLQYLKAKRWDLGNIPSWRGMSNNSVICNDFANLPDQIWEGYEGNGEPYGLINLGLARSVGRAGDTQYPDPDVCGFNPCAEQPLAPYETCCLAEIHLPNIESREELLDVAKFLYRINKHSLALPCHWKETEVIVHKNMRMGIGITGYAMATKEQKSWLDKTYKQLREYDAEYSAKKRFPESIKLTTIKPSGTQSLLSGVTPGAHPGFSHHHIRRVRMASNIPLVEKCRELGYPMEPVRNFDGTEDHGTMVVEFPCKFPEHTIVADQTNAIEQLEVVKRLQAEWSDNAVSVTVYYKKQELLEIKNWLSKNYNKSIKSVSFLLHSDHGFDQAPLEKIDAIEYNKRMKGIKPITNVEVGEDSINEDQIGCIGGACPIK